LVGDHLYGTQSRGGLVAVEFTTGKVKWKAENFGMSSGAYADGYLYIHDETGDCVLVEATPEGYREKGRCTPPNPPKKNRWARCRRNRFRIR
jgi:outer membrane protein assembly factor BamB